MKVTEVWNGTRQSVSIFQDGKLVLNETGGDGSSSRTSYVYDAAGQEIESFRQTDNNADGVFDSSMRTLKTYVDGRLATETALSPDFDGDGAEGDYTTTTTYAYDAAGRMTAKHTEHAQHGVVMDLDRATETWVYDSVGRLLVNTIDDPAMFDFVITRSYHYKHGNLQNIKLQDEFLFGGARPRIVESFTYNKDGSVKTETDWATHSEYGWFQRVDTAFTRKAGYDSQRITYDLEGNFDPERVELEENWYDAAGNHTHTLTTHDVDGNGTWDVRDLTVRTFNEWGLASETTDYGADGSVEETYFKTVEPDFVLV